MIFLQLYSYSIYINESKEAIFHFLTWNVKAEVREGCKDKSQANYSVSGNQAASSLSVTLQLDAANLGRRLRLTWMSCCCTHCLREQDEHPSWQVVYSFYLSFIKSENKVSPAAKSTLKSKRYSLFDKTQSPWLLVLSITHSL